MLLRSFRLHSFMLCLPERSKHLQDVSRGSGRRCSCIYIDVKHKKAFSSHSEVKNQNELLKYLRLRVEATGPITVAEYMKEVLTNPLSGYYMQHDVFGSSGDFVTSPEISQMFGEIVGLWFYNEWSKVGQPKPLQIVELGPGKGTLIDDILKVFSKLISKKHCLSVHLVEVSPFFCHVQKMKLCCVNQSSAVEVVKPIHFPRGISGDFYEKQFATTYSIPIMWHNHLKSVPEGFSLFLAHEFFDALPIHKFQKTAGGWREILIGSRDTSVDPQGGQLHFVLSRGPTPATQIFIDPAEQREHVEISPDTWVLVEQLTKRMKEDGGISLIVDYGHEGDKGDTFRSFKKHAHHDPLADPGTADLTADVDFYRLKKVAENSAISFGPIAQSDFLKNMGIDIRLEKLLQCASSQEQEILKSGHDLLTNPEKMGHRFKFFAMFPLVLKDFLERYPPAGFM